MDVLTDEGFKNIRWCIESTPAEREWWLVYPIMHAGDGPLGKGGIVRGGMYRITAADAAESFASRDFDVDALDVDGLPVTVSLAVHVADNDFIWFDVKVRATVTYDAMNRK